MRRSKIKSQKIVESNQKKYVDDVHLDDVRENKNLKIAAKKISDKYKKVR